MGTRGRGLETYWWVGLGSRGILRGGDRGLLRGGDRGRRKGTRDLLRGRVSEGGTRDLPVYLS